MSRSQLVKYHPRHQCVNDSTVRVASFSDILCRSKLPKCRYFASRGLLGINLQQINPAEYSSQVDAHHLNINCLFNAQGVVNARNAAGSLDRARSQCVPASVVQNPNCDPPPPYGHLNISAPPYLSPVLAPSKGGRAARHIIHHSVRILWPFTCQERLCFGVHHGDPSLQLGLKGMISKLNDTSATGIC
jgi:hypothetical protein